MKKLLVVLDHYDQDMFNVSNQQVINNFKNSEVGKILLGRIIGHPRTGIDTKNCNVKIEFFYSQVPRINPHTNASIKPKIKDLEDAYANLKTRIAQYQPDLIVTYGSWFVNQLLKEVKFDKGQLELIHLQTDWYDGYLSCNPSLLLPTKIGTNNGDRLRIENRFINRFLKGGIENTKPQFGKYQMITDFNQIKHIFEDILPKQPIVALDTETNTLETYRKGAKAIMFSMSWKEHQGIAIPVQHPQANDVWTPDQLTYIIEHTKQLIMSDQLKVMHNASYDIRMFMDVYDLPYATNVRDTMLLYYETVCEEQGALRGLKHLAYMYTDMGGYENQRDIDFQKYLDQRYQTWYDTEMQKYENKQRSRKPTRNQYKEPRNEVDGGKVDFDWIPLKDLYEYAAADTDVTLQLYHIFDKNVQKRPKWETLCYDFYPKMIDTLSYMTHTGFQLDQQKLKNYRKHFTDEMQNIVKQMYDQSPEINQYEQDNLAKLREREQIKQIPPKKRTAKQKKLFTEYAKLRGTDNNGLEKYKFNPSSGQQIAYLFYKMLGYKLPAEKDYLKPKSVRKAGHPEKLTWTDYKTDRKSALPFIAENYHDPLAKLFLTYSNDKKMLNGTIDSYEKIMDDTYKVHPKYLLTGTVTGRLASREPNSQNIRKPTSNTDDPNYHYSAKGLFTSRFKGGYLLNFDYKSLEVFIASVISKDTGMIQALMDGADIHKRNASIAFDIPIKEVDPEHRQLAKAVN